MDARARLSSKGRLTVPKHVRDALDLHEGDEVLFRVERARAAVARTPDFLDMAGMVPVPAGKRGTLWDEIVRHTRVERTRRRR